MKQLSRPSAFAKRRIGCDLTGNVEAVLRFALEAHQGAITIYQHGVGRNLKERPQPITLRLREGSAIPPIGYEKRALSGSARRGGPLQLVKCAGQRHYASMSLRGGSCGKPPGKRDA